MAHSPLRRVLSVIRRQVDPDASGPAADDRLLARFARNGDASAFELLVWRHGSMVLGVCRRVLGDHQFAEDAFQATFLALARKPKAVRNGASLPGWLHRVARRIAVRARIDNAKRFERDRRAARCELVTDDVFSADTQAVIDEEIDRLPEKLRRAIVLCYLEGQTAEQAAQLLGCPRGTVLSRLAAARERLRTRLTRRGLGVSIGGLAAGLATAEVSAAVVATTTNAALTGGASIQVIAWANGVLYAMLLSKIKFATGAVLTTGMLGAGVGWVAVPGHGTGIVGESQAAAAPADDRANRERDEAMRQRQLAEQARLQAEQAEAALQAAKAATANALQEREIAVAQLQAVMKDLEALKKRSDERSAGSTERSSEKNDADYRRMQVVYDTKLANHAAEFEKRAVRLTQLRLSQAEAEERFKSLEQAQADKRERQIQNLKAARSALETFRSRVQGTLKGRPKNEEESRDFDAMRGEISSLEDKVAAAEKALEEDDRKRLEERLKAREAVIRAEEEIKMVDRRWTMEDSAWSSQMAALQDRLRSTGSITSDRLADLERKLDALAREFTEIRRELKK